MMKYTRTHAQAAYERLRDALGKQEHVWKKDAKGHLRATPGQWTLDYNAMYGGARIEEIHNDAGAVTTPLGDNRMSPREFVYAVRFALDVLRVAKGGR